MYIYGYGVCGRVCFELYATLLTSLLCGFAYRIGTWCDHDTIHTYYGACATDKVTTHMHTDTKQASKLVLVGLQGTLVCGGLRTVDTITGK